MMKDNVVFDFAPFATIYAGGLDNNNPERFIYAVYYVGDAFPRYYFFHTEMELVDNEIFMTKKFTEKPAFIRVYNLGDLSFVDAGSFSFNIPFVHYSVRELEKRDGSIVLKLKKVWKDKRLIEINDTISVINWNLNFNEVFSFEVSFRPLGQIKKDFNLD